VNNKKVIIAGGGSFGHEIYDLFCSDESSNIIGFLDDDKNCILKQRTKDLIHFGELFCDDLGNEYSLHIATGNWELNNKLFKFYKSKNYDLHTFIHPKSIISETSIIGEGCYIGPNAIVSTNTVIESNVSVNFFSGIGHDCIIGKNSILSPQVMINGNCKVGESAFFGTRSTIFENLKIGKYSTIDSGTILTHDLEDFSIASGREVSKVYEDKIKKHFYLNESDGVDS
tara:strand:+ start:5760 stop:6443 length:684 start_codon:yes stop_codon:yes gene_type:complete